MNRISLILLLLVVVVVGVGGYSYWQQQQQAAGGITEEQDLAREAFLEERGGDAMLRTVGGGTPGEVVSVEGDTVVIKDDAGTETQITLAADGRVVRPTEGERADVHVGDTVTVLTQMTDDGAVAMMVQLGGGGGEIGAGGPIMTAPLVFNGDTPSNSAAGGGTSQMPAITSIMGTVEAVEADSITINPPEGDPVTIALTDDTRVQKMETLTLSDLQPGMMVSALGEKQDEGQVDVTEITVLPDMMIQPLPEQ